VDSQIEHASVENQQSDHEIFIVEETDESISTSATTLNTPRLTANNQGDLSVDESGLSGGNPQEVNLLPHDGKSNPCNPELETRQQADAVCSICLLGYNSGDHVAWSKKSTCQHTFHRDCLVTWLLMHDECPNCRCSYFETEINNDSDLTIVDSV